MIARIKEISSFCRLDWNYVWKFAVLSMKMTSNESTHSKLLTITLLLLKYYVQYK